MITSLPPSMRRARDRPDVRAAVTVSVSGAAPARPYRRCARGARAGKRGTQPPHAPRASVEAVVAVAAAVAVVVAATAWPADTAGGGSGPCQREGGGGADDSRLASSQCSVGRASHRPPPAGPCVPVVRAHARQPGVAVPARGRGRGGGGGGSGGGGEGGGDIGRLATTRRRQPRGSSDGGGVAIARQMAFVSGQRGGGRGRDGRVRPGGGESGPPRRRCGEHRAQESRLPLQSRSCAPSSSPLAGTGLVSRRWALQRGCQYIGLRRTDAPCPRCLGRGWVAAANAIRGGYYPRLSPFWPSCPLFHGYHTTWH